MENQKKVIVVLNDLLFRVKIQDAAKRVGLTVAFLPSEQAVLAESFEQIRAVILDLNDPQSNPLHIVETLRSNPETNNIPLIGYVSHTQTELIQTARAKGCSEVMARSAFVQNLSSILSRYKE